MKYRKKPVLIDAVQWTGKNKEEIEIFCGDNAIFCRVKCIDNSFPSYWTIKIKTLEGDMNVCINDYIIKGIEGEYYPCKDYIFKRTYEKIDE